MSAGFTPGPWDALQRTADPGIAGRSAASYVIPSSLSEEERKYPHDYAVARCFTSLNGYDPVAEREANSRLIATAPELYDLLEWLLGSYDLGVVGAERATALLAKARGDA